MLKITEYLIIMCAVASLTKDMTKIVTKSLDDSTKVNTTFVDLSNARTHEDSVNTINFNSFNENGNRKPPCTLSPDSCECMESRGIEVRIWDCD